MRSINIFTVGLKFAFPKLSAIRSLLLPRLTAVLHEFLFIFSGRVRLNLESFEDRSRDDLKGKYL